MNPLLVEIRRTIKDIKKLIGEDIFPIEINPPIKYNPDKSLFKKSIEWKYIHKENIGYLSNIIYNYDYSNSLDYRGYPISSFPDYIKQKVLQILIDTKNSLK